MPPSRHLILFTRYPVPGRTKTRLIPALGAAGAARLQQKLTEHITAVLPRLSATRVTILFAGGNEAAMRRWLGPQFAYAPQHRGDLGIRLNAASEHHFATSSQPLAIIGADCPALLPTDIEDAFDQLTGHDLVLGPARDGGYYLIAVRRHNPTLFDHIPWGTDQVLDRTLARAATAGLSTFLLPMKTDIDRPEDLTRASLPPSVALTETTL